MRVESRPVDDAAVAAERDRSPALPRWVVPALVVGDVASFLVFAGVGRGNHGETTGLAAFGAVVGTALPFAVAWFAVAPWLGAFRRRTFATPLRALARTELAWLAAWPVALLLRGLTVDHGVPPLSFAIVLLVANAVFLGLWRTAFAFLLPRVRR